MEHEKQTPEDSSRQEMVDRVYRYAADLLIEKKLPAAEVINSLKKEGLDEESATTVVESLEQHIAAARKEKGKKDMLWGGIWCVGGIIVTVVTMNAASNGGSYVVAWGAIIFGAIQFFRGASNV